VLICEKDNKLCINTIYSAAHISDKSACIGPFPWFHRHSFELSNQKVHSRVEREVLQKKKKLCLQ